MSHSVVRLESVKTSICVGMLLFASGPLLGCQDHAIMARQPSFEAMLNSGQQEHRIALDERIVINFEQEQQKWEVSLGRRDNRNAIYEYFDNKSQASLRFTQAGTYQAALGSHPGAGQNATIMITLTIVVH